MGCKGREFHMSLIRGTVVWGVVLLPALPAQAGPIWDCLTGKSKQPTCQGGVCQTPTAMPIGTPVGAPVLAQYPVTSAYYPVAYPQTGVASSVAPVGNTVPTAGMRGYTPYAAAPIAAYRPVAPATPVHAYRPWTTPYAASPVAMAPVAGVPVTVGTAPVGVVANAPALPAGTTPVCAACQRPMTVNIAPQVSYRSSWVQVPVTSYRPVAGVDPRTGQYVTVYQPCTTSTWQLQRVPTLVQRPLMAGAPAGVHVCANGACGVAAPVGTPYYGAPTVGAPMTGAPIQGAPIMGGTGFGVPAGPIGGTPADRPPSLNPNDLQPAGPQIRNYPPIDSPTSSFGVPGAAGTAQGVNAMVPVPPSTVNGLGVPAANPYSSAVTPPPSTPNVPNTITPNTVVPGTSAPAVSTPSVPSTAPVNKSIPDPETKSAKRDREVPPLLSIPNRAASNRGQSNVSLIPTRLIERVPSPPSADRGAQGPLLPVPQAEAPIDVPANEPVLDGPRTKAVLNDDGWRSVPQPSR